MQLFTRHKYLPQEDAQNSPSDDLCRSCELEAETPTHILLEYGAVTHSEFYCFDTFVLEEAELPTMRPSKILSFLGKIGLRGEL